MRLSFGGCSLIEGALLGGTGAWAGTDDDEEAGAGVGAGLDFCCGAFSRLAFCPGSIGAIESICSMIWSGFACGSLFGQLSLLITWFTQLTCQRR